MAWGENQSEQVSHARREAGSTSAFQPSAWITFANILLTQAKCEAKLRGGWGTIVINTRHGYPLTQLTQLISYIHLYN